MPKDTEGRPTPRPRVFDYEDYRAFLSDLVAYLKQRQRGFSYRRFSRDAGLGSPNYLKLVIDGKRNVSSKMAERFAEALRLPTEHAKFFVALVSFCQASRRDELRAARARLMSFRQYRDTHQLQSHQYNYFSKWYVPAIREMITLKGFQNDPHWIANQLCPTVSVQEVRSAIDTLKSLGLVEERAGRLKPVRALVTSGREAPSDLLVVYHEQMIELGRESMERFPRDERDVSNVTLALGSDGLERLKLRVQEFRRDLLELSTREEHPTQIVQLNLQLFPLSKNGNTQ